MQMKHRTTGSPVCAFIIFVLVLFWEHVQSVLDVFQLALWCEISSFCAVFKYRELTLTVQCKLDWTSLYYFCED
jgi:hypothetical protein